MIVPTVFYVILPSRGLKLNSTEFIGTTVYIGLQVKGITSAFLCSKSQCVCGLVGSSEVYNLQTLSCLKQEESG